jgi:hypothetical protein
MGVGNLLSLCVAVCETVQVIEQYNINNLALQILNAGVGLSAMTDTYVTCAIFLYTAAD